LLLWLGVDYPKSHDVGGLAVRVLAERALACEPAFGTWLEEFSTDLAAKRAPSFYCEEDYSSEDATLAAEGAERILTWVTGMVAS